MRKSLTTISFHRFYLFTWKNLHFVRKNICKNLVNIVMFILQLLHLAGSWKCSDKTPTPI